MRTSFWVLAVLALQSACGAPERGHDPVPAAPGGSKPTATEPASVESTPGLSGTITLPALVSEGLGSSGAHALLRELCTAAPHRLAGSEGATEAVAWARETMERIGLENVRLEPCLVPCWERGAREELVVVEPSEHAGERLPILALGGSVATPSAGLEAEVLAVSGFDELHERAAEASGKLVFFRRPMDPTVLDPFEAYGSAVNQRGSGAIEAARVGGVGALVRSVTCAGDDEPHTGAMRYAEGLERVPAAAVGVRSSERLDAWLASGRRVVLRLTLDCAWHEEMPSHNVVGEIVGRELPREVVLIGAHLDAWDVGEGAHDDGAGCAHVLEAARLLLETGLGRPRRTVRCVLFMNEENGLRGAAAYRDAHRSELGRHVLAIESDRGGAVPIGYATDASGEALATLVALWGGRAVARGGGADISPLAEFGVPLAGLVPSPQRYFDVHHSRNDVLAAVHPRELQLGAVSLASMAWLAAELERSWPRNAGGPAEGD